MATCPDCGAFLGERHRCAPAWRRWWRMARSLGTSAAIGALVAAVVFTIADEHVSRAALGVSAAVAIVIDLAIHSRP